MPRYTYRRVSALPATDDGLHRYVELNGPDAMASLTVRHTVMQPGAVLAESEDDVDQLFITISGRGVMLVDSDRIEVSSNEVVFVRAGCPCGLQTLGGTPWVYLLVQSGDEAAVG